MSKSYGASFAVPHVRIRRCREPVRAVVLVLHGGAEHGNSIVRPWGLAHLRMVPIANAIAKRGSRDGIAVWLLRNRINGWNAPGLPAVGDARWALRGIHTAHPGVPVVVIGHSMGGRVALRVADDPAIVGVCALAPWTPPCEPIDPVTNRSVLIAHGTRDKTTDPHGSYAYGARAEQVASRLVRHDVSGESHAMLRKPGTWMRLIHHFVSETLDHPRSAVEASQ